MSLYSGNLSFQNSPSVTMVTANCDVGLGKALYYTDDKWLCKLLVPYAKLSETSPWKNNI